MNQGISILQGEHQVAQKSSRTTLPWKSARWIDLPLASAKVNEGAGLPIKSSGFAGFDAVPLVSLAATVVPTLFAPREQAVKETMAASEAPRTAVNRIFDTGFPLFKLYRDSPLWKGRVEPRGAAPAMLQGKREFRMAMNS